MSEAPAVQRSPARRDLEGRRIPDVRVKVRRNDTWQDVGTRELFAARKVVVFSLPGAFTPTCSTAHVPRFNELAPVFRKHGFDDIVCFAVNDPYVMEAWQRDQHADRITFVADGNGDFTRAMGMVVDKREDCLGERSWRYAMVVEDGGIVKAYVEPDEPGDPYTVSDADTVLRDLVPGTEVPPDIFMLTKPGCSHCAKARHLLDGRGIAYDAVEATPRMLRAVSDLPPRRRYSSTAVRSATVTSWSAGCAITDPGDGRRTRHAFCWMGAWGAVRREVVQPLPGCL